MTGATIDHMISLTILIAALMVAMLTYSSMFATAVDYDRNRQVANKAVDLMNTICLSPGNPANWGDTNVSVLGFGLQDLQVGGYALDPFSLMRLETNHSDGGSSLVEYPQDSGIFYNNISTSYGHAILIPVGDCISYTYATELLGVNGTYGFSLDIVPTLDVVVSQVDTSPLKINIDVSGSGMPISGASLNYYIFEVENIASFPCIITHSGFANTNISGSAEITISEIDDTTPVYSLIVYASLSGVNGVGYFSSNTAPDDVYIIPFVDNYDEGELILAHSFEILYPGLSAEVKYNATFYSLTSDFHVQEFALNCSGHLNSGEGFPDVRTQIPPSEVGVLAISYLKSSNEMGSIIVPWGIGALGVSASFDNGSDSSIYDFIATELRQVTINGISYQVKVSAWKLGS